MTVLPISSLPELIGLRASREVGLVACPQLIGLPGSEGDEHLEGFGIDGMETSSHRDPFDVSSTAFTLREHNLLPSFGQNVVRHVEQAKLSSPWDRLGELLRVPKHPNIWAKSPG
jgi:hypothetical protein